MKLMMSKDGFLVTQDGERVENVENISYTMDMNNAYEHSSTQIDIANTEIYEGDVKPAKEDLEPKPNDEVSLKLISDGTINPEGTKLIDVNTGRIVTGVKSITYCVDAGKTSNGTILVEFNRMAIEAGFINEAVAFNYEEAIAFDRKERSLRNRLRKMFKKLW